MSVAVRKSPLVVIKPSVPQMTTLNINLSPYDIPFFRVATRTMFLVFDHPIHDPIETIKRGLSQALVHYKPLAGRLGGGVDNDKPYHIRCTEEGVPFLAASANCTLKDIRSFGQSLIEDLAMFYTSEVVGPTDSLLMMLMMQMTEFSCGGFIVGITMSHAIVDGKGMAQFLQAVGELARGLPSPSVVPVRWDAYVMTAIPTSSLYDMNLQQYGMASQSINVSSSLINMIKERFFVYSNGQSCTTLDAVTAVIWQCRTRVIISDPEAPTALDFVADARKHIGAKDGYYGNCFTGHVFMVSSGTVANGDIMNLVKMIQRAKNQIQADRFKGERENILKKVATLKGYNVFAVSSVQNLGFEQADFGGGRPARVMSYTRQRVTIPSCMILPPCKREDGTDVLSLCVKEQHAEAFLRELERFMPAMSKF